MCADSKSASPAGPCHRAESPNAVGLCHRMCGNADLPGATGAALASDVAMRRLVTLTLILTTATVVAGVYVRETRNRDWPPIVSPIPATVTPVEGTTRHGLIAHVDTRNRSLEIEVNGHQERIFWDDRTLITVAKHRAKMSVLAPGSTVFVDVQQREDRLQASLIAVSPPNRSW